MSNPFYREIILQEGLIPKGRSETWIAETNINGEVIFASSHEDPSKWFDSGYNDDIYKIETCHLESKWFNDPNFDKEYGHVITFERIPPSMIELIHSGTGENTDLLGKHPFIKSQTTKMSKT